MNNCEVAKANHVEVGKKFSKVGIASRSTTVVITDLTQKLQGVIIGFRDLYSGEHYGLPVKSFLKQYPFVLTNDDFGVSNQKNSESLNIELQPNKTSTNNLVTIKCFSRDSSEVFFYNTNVNSNDNNIKILPVKEFKLE